eukprot:2171738-Rhodomonas_salina.1
MSGITVQPNIHERRDWWYSCIGSCCVCGVPLQFPLGDEGHSLQQRTDVDTLLFQYGLLHAVDAGHLIDRYILDTTRRFIKDGLGKGGLQRFHGLHLKTGHDWLTSMHDFERLDSLIAQAERFTVPICHDCNMAMTKIESDIAVLFYSVLRPEYFDNERIPFEFLQQKRAHDSKAKQLQAIFIFTDMLPESHAYTLYASVHDDDDTTEDYHLLSGDEEAANEENSAIALMYKYGKLSTDDTTPSIEFDEDGLQTQAETSSQYTRSMPIIASTLAQTRNQRSGDTSARNRRSVDSPQAGKNQTKTPAPNSKNNKQSDLPLYEMYDKLFAAKEQMSELDAKSLVGLMVIGGHKDTNGKTHWYWGKVVNVFRNASTKQQWKWTVFFPDLNQDQQIYQTYTQKGLQTQARNVFEDDIIPEFAREELDFDADPLLVNQKDKTSVSPRSTQQAGPAPAQSVDSDVPHDDHDLNHPPPPATLGTDNNGARQKEADS